MSKKSQGLSLETSHGIDTNCTDTHCPLCVFRRNSRETFKHLEGRILTIIDSAIEDEQQNKALKDLVRQEIEEHREGLREIYDTMWEKELASKIEYSYPKHSYELANN